MPNNKFAPSFKSTPIPIALLDSIEHVSFNDLSKDLQVKLKRAGSETTRSNIEAVMMYDKIPPPFRTSIKTIKNWLNGKDASHIISRYNGGSDNPCNLVWENSIKNRFRSSNNMTSGEQLTIITNDFVSGLSKSCLNGIRSAPMGAAIAVVTAMPITFLEYSFAVAKGKMTKEEAMKAALQDVSKQGVIGGISTAVVVITASLFPPVAAVLTLVAPTLAYAGVGGMLLNYYTVIDDNKELISKLFSSTENEVELLNKPIREIHSSISKNKMDIEENWNFMYQVHDLQIKSQLGFDFSLYWILINIIVGVSGLSGVINFANNDLDKWLSGLFWLSLFMGFIQWLLIYFRAYMILPMPNPNSQ